MSPVLPRYPRETERRLTQLGDLARGLVYGDHVSGLDLLLQHRL